MEIIIVNLCVIMLLLVIRPFWKSFVVEFHRDQLFDLRDELREWYIEFGIEQDEVYKNIRQMLNHHIRYLKDADFRSFKNWVEFYNKTPNYRKIVIQDFSKEFATDDDRIKIITLDILNRTSFVFRKYYNWIVTTNFLKSLLKCVIISMRAMFDGDFKGSYDNVKSYCMFFYSTPKTNIQFVGKIVKEKVVVDTPSKIDKLFEIKPTEGMLTLTKKGEKENNRPLKASNKYINVSNNDGFTPEMSLVKESFF